MASPDFGSPWMSSTIESFAGSFDMGFEEGPSDGSFSLFEVSTSSVVLNRNSPKPPPLPRKITTKPVSWLPDCCCIPKETKHMWDKIFSEGLEADVFIVTQDEVMIPAHSSILRVASPILGNLLQQSKEKNGIRYIKIRGVPYEAARAFVRFIYSSCYEEAEMKKFVLHLLVLSHSYMVPSLKRICIHILEHGWLTTENVIDVLQLARNCDAPRLSLICLRMVERDFRNISSTEGWKIMKRSNPALEQELLELVVEADSKKQERLKKIEERKVYLQLHEAMEALLHICRDGCRTIGPRDKVLKGSQVPCSFPACKGVENLVRHFSACKARVHGSGCVQCKRMWQLLELHSRMCNEPDYCKVPLCRHFKVKMQQQSRKEEKKWKLLASKVIAARNTLGPFASRGSSLYDADTYT